MFLINLLLFYFGKHMSKQSSLFQLLDAIDKASSTLNKVTSNEDLQKLYKQYGITDNTHPLAKITEQMLSIFPEKTEKSKEEKKYTSNSEQYVSTTSSLNDLFGELFTILGDSAKASEETNSKPFNDSTVRKCTKNEFVQESETKLKESEIVKDSLPSQEQLNDILDLVKDEVDEITSLTMKYTMLINRSFTHINNGKTYVLLDITNTESTYQNEFPITVVYLDVIKATKLSRPLIEFSKYFKLV